jgi:hypothetical protein
MVWTKSNYSGIATKRHKTHNESRKGANQSQFCWLHQAHFHPFPFCVSCASSWLSSYDEKAIEAAKLIKFVPARDLNGRQIDYRQRIKVTFTLL